MRSSISLSSRTESTPTVSRLSGATAERSSVWAAFISSSTPSAFSALTSAVSKKAALFDATSIASRIVSTASCDSVWKLSNVARGLLRGRGARGERSDAATGPASVATAGSAVWAVARPALQHNAIATIRPVRSQGENGRDGRLAAENTVIRSAF